jgi:hypothetical protein
MSNSKTIAGTIVRHYKNKFYVVRGTVMNSETLKPMVNYQSLYKYDGSRDDITDYQKWVRPLDMFLDKVEYEGNICDRFEIVEKPSRELVTLAYNLNE